MHITMMRYPEKYRLCVRQGLPIIKSIDLQGMQDIAIRDISCMGVSFPDQMLFIWPTRRLLLI